jgi:hypothetical protein
MGYLGDSIFPSSFTLPTMTADEYAAMVAVAEAANWSAPGLILNTTDNKLYYCTGRSPYNNYFWGELVTVAMT